MRILQINCWYDMGSTGKIVQAIHSYALLHGHESYVIYGMGQKNDDLHAFRTTSPLLRKAQSFCTRLTGYPYGGCPWGTFHALNYIQKIKPDIVHIQCMNGYMVNIYSILKFLKAHEIPTVITNHAEFMFTGGCTHAVDCEQWKTGCIKCNKIGKEHPKSYFFDRVKEEWELMQNAYKGFKNLYICCVSDWLRNRARQSPFYHGYKVETVLNGVNTDIFNSHLVNYRLLREKLGLRNRKIVIHVTPGFDSPIKGGKHVVEMARRFPYVDFLVVGDGKRIPQYPANLKFAGRINDQKLLSDIYALGDVTLLTSLRETFSMVTAESLCCGTPVVGFKAGGPETIALRDYSSFVEQGDDDQLYLQLNQMLSKQFDKKKFSQIACETYSDQTMCRNYFKVYEELLSQSHVRHP